MMMSAFEPAVTNGSNDNEQRSSRKTSSPPGLRRSSFDSEGEPYNDQVDESRHHRAEIEVDANTSDADTEDEEVKIHCIGGLSAVRDSDISDDEISESEDDDSGTEVEDLDPDVDCESDRERADAGLLNFVSRKIDMAPTSPVIKRPTPTILRASQQPIAFSRIPSERDSTSMSSDSEDSTNSAFPVGARGIGLSLGPEKSGASGDEDEDDLEESSDSEDDQASTDENEDEVSIADGDSDGSRENLMEEEVDEESDVDEIVRSEVEDDEPSSSQQVEETFAGEIDFNRQYLSAEQPIYDLKPSPSLQEIESMIDAENDEDITDSNAGEKDSRISEELSDILSEGLEFDYWSRETLDKVVDVLSSYCDVDDLSSTNERYPIRLPARDNAAFWVDKLGSVAFSNSHLKMFLEQNPSQRISASRHVYNSFHAEMMSLDITRIRVEGSEALPNGENKMPPDPLPYEPKLFVGSFSSAESRLVLAFLNIRKIIQVSYHHLDELWVNDGIDYSSYVLQSAAGGNAIAYHAIREGAEEINATVMQDTAPGAVLVTCSTGDEHSCAICALFISKFYCIPTEDAAAMVAKHRSSCRIDPDWLRDGSLENRHSHKTKRVLSSNMLSSLNSGIGFEPLKRIRCLEDSSLPPRVPLLPTLNLGPAAYGHDIAGRESLQIRGSEGYMSSSTEEEEEREQDMRLSEELQEAGDVQEKPSTPVPLLTPPASPVQVESEEGPTTVCEWPSNLTVDRAMASAIDLRPLSPDSLQRKEEEEERRIHLPSSTLTPLIRGISVTLD